MNDYVVKAVNSVIPLLTHIWSQCQFFIYHINHCTKFNKLLAQAYWFSLVLILIF